MGGRQGARTVGLVLVETHDHPVIVDEAAGMGVQHRPAIADDHDAFPHIIAIPVQVFDRAQELKAPIAADE